MEIKQCLQVDMILQINIIFSFNQHIPLKIKQDELNESDAMGSHVQYGGGKFQILVSREI